MECLGSQTGRFPIRISAWAALLRWRTDFDSYLGISQTIQPSHPPVFSARHPGSVVATKRRWSYLVSSTNSLPPHSYSPEQLQTKREDNALSFMVPVHSATWCNCKAQSKSLHGIHIQKMVYFVQLFQIQIWASKHWPLEIGVIKSLLFVYHGPNQCVQLFIRFCVCPNKPSALRLCYESRLLYYAVYIHTSYTVVYDNCARVLYRCTTSASRGLVCLL